MFLQNAWYMAGWSEDIKHVPMLRTVADEHILLFRKMNGSVAAISDTCPHRFSPLHKGALIEDAIECPYHGLRFDSTGSCVHNPHGDGHIPRSVKVKSYPVTERDTITWVWIGDPAEQDTSKIVDYSILNDAKDQFTFTAGGTLRMNICYELIIDNLMDLSHAAFLHKKNLGSEALARGNVSVRTEGTTVYSDRMGPNGLPSPMMVMTGACKADDLVDFWVDMRWSPPANFYLETGIVPAGQSRYEHPRLMPSVQVLAPETKTSTLYYIKLFRNYNRDAPGMSESILEAVLAAFRDEDEAMVQLVSDRMAGRDFWSMKPLLLHGDAGAVQARRMLEKLIQQQAQAA